MPNCLHPRQGYLPSSNPDRRPAGMSGRIVFDERKAGSDYRILEIPCGQCMHCRQNVAAQWKNRLILEASLHEHCQFATLTYSDKNLPHDGGLDREAMPEFMRRLRERLRPYGSRRGKLLQTVRYFGCGEYGENFSRRPHYHILLFGLSVPDRRLWRTTPAGAPSYRSDFLEEIWPFGHVEFSDVTASSIAYVSGYSIKKLNGKLGAEAYRRSHPITGEVFDCEPPFAQMSRRPGIGKNWFERFKADCFPSDYLVIDGRKVPVPKYFFRLFESDDPEAASAVREAREFRSLEPRNRARAIAEAQPERIAAKEEIAHRKALRQVRDLGDL